MPIFTFTSPEGKSYTVNGPDGATKEQAFYVLQQQLAGGAASSSKSQDMDEHGIPLPTGAAERMADEAAQVKKKEPSMLDKIVGAGEAGLNLVSSIPAAIPGSIAAVKNILTNGKFGTNEGVREAENKFADVSSTYAYEPRTEVGKEYAANVANAINDSGIVGIPQLELARLAQTIPSAAKGAKLAFNKATGRTPLAAQAAAELAATTPEEASAVNAASGSRVPESDPTLYRFTKQVEGGNLPDAEKMERAQVLQRIGMDQARESAIAGDSAEAANQAQIAKFTQEPAGLAAKDIFDSERTALQKHASNIVADTGGSYGVDESSLNARGQTIATPFDELRQYFNAETDMLYKMADDASKGAPETNLKSLKKFLETKSNFSGKAENSTLGNGISHYLYEQGIMDGDGNLLPVTPKQAEGIKQYINGQWSPGTSGLSGKIKGLIDKDVFKGAGEDIYAKARNMYKMQKATLDNPNGISKLMDFDPHTPINRATPFEKIPDTLTRLPAAQFGHVIDVLDKMIDPIYQTPDILVLQAHDALNEIRAHMANALLEIGSKQKGQWNATGVTQYLKNNSAKFKMAFGPDVLSKIRDLNDAGHILSADKSYPGAAAQAALAVKNGLLPRIAGKSLAGVGGLAGSFGGPIVAGAGAAVGNAAGDSIASKIGGAASLKKFNSGIVNLSDYKPQSLPVSSIEPVEATAQYDRLQRLRNEIGSIKASTLPVVYDGSINDQLLQNERASRNQESKLADEIARMKELKRQQAMKDLSNAPTVDAAIDAFQRVNF